ncbi:hypothetical protein HUS70_04915 [Pandoraea nosoerga]|uniref:hypothetical protein n=1 Tax=Pandoraea nosoerga TaxID=2508296 RepID=UPI0012405FF3|nr:hypothetical protein [Pandoraea nosoerga]MBN4665322.1 hypothetical protein [Pandoraea nosoerga]MBN4674722.1 hypothetical protein [Pandoraea nosoerga]MBN4680611.1 hypothetical protein [Pandoraea nosoerga]MBN4744016.1 hypothetical protein [Pandoraea nosoerga]
MHRGLASRALNTWPRGASGLPRMYAAPQRRRSDLITQRCVDMLRPRERVAALAAQTGDGAAVAVRPHVGDMPGSEREFDAVGREAGRVAIDVDFPAGVGARDGHLLLHEGEIGGEVTGRRRAGHAFGRVGAETRGAGAAIQGTQ